MCVCVCVCLSVSMCVYAHMSVFDYVCTINHFLNTHHLLIQWMINSKTGSAVLWIVACLEAKLGTDASIILVTISSSRSPTKQSHYLMASGYVNSLYCCHLLEEEVMYETLTNKQHIWLYCIMGNFNKFSKSIGCQRIQNNIFKKQIDILLSKNQALQI